MFGATVFVALAGLAAVAQADGLPSCYVSQLLRRLRTIPDTRGTD